MHLFVPFIIPTKPWEGIFPVALRRSIAGFTLQYSAHVEGECPCAFPKCVHSCLSQKQTHELPSNASIYILFTNSDLLSGSTSLQKKH